MSAEQAVARGGPLDGTVLGDAGADHFEVTMLDGSRHRYERTAERTAAGVVYAHRPVRPQRSPRDQR